MVKFCFRVSMTTAISLAATTLILMMWDIFNKQPSSAPMFLCLLGALLVLAVILIPIVWSFE